MRAMQLQQAGCAAAVAESDKVLAEDPELERQILQLVRVADRLPESSHVLAAGRVWADMRQLGVFLRHMAVVVSAVTALKERGPRCHRKPPVHDDLAWAVASAACNFSTRILDSRGP